MKTDDRRRLLKSLATGSAAVATGMVLPKKWAKPVVDSVILPAHAATTDDSGSLPGEQGRYYGSVTVIDDDPEADVPRTVYQICIECLAGNCTAKVLESYPDEPGDVYFYQGSGAYGSTVTLTQPNSCDEYTVKLSVISAIDVATGHLDLIDEENAIILSADYSIPMAECGISAADAVCNDDVEKALLPSQASPIKHH